VHMCSVWTFQEVTPHSIELQEARLPKWSTPPENNLDPWLSNEGFKHRFLINSQLKLTNTIR
jgi:hypothetical protein